MAETINLNPPVNLQSVHVDEVQDNIFDDPNVQNQELEVNTPVQEMTEERLELLDKIDDYRFSRFRDRILAFDSTCFDNLHILSDEELQSRLNFLQKFVSKKNNSKQGEHLFRAALSLTDMGFNFLGFQTQGVKEKLLEDDSVLDIVEEIRLKYSANMYIEPEKRLFFAVLNAYVEVDNLHKIAPRMKPQEVENKIKNHLDSPENNLKINLLISKKNNNE